MFVVVRAQCGKYGTGKYAAIPGFFCLNAQNEPSPHRQCTKARIVTARDRPQPTIGPFRAAGLFYTLGFCSFPLSFLGNTLAS